MIPLPLHFTPYVIGRREIEENIARPTDTGKSIIVELKNRRLTQAPISNKRILNAKMYLSHDKKQLISTLTCDLILYQNNLYMAESS